MDRVYRGNEFTSQVRIIFPLYASENQGISFAIINRLNSPLTKIEISTAVNGADLVK
jgi:hypothetical protein